MIKALSIGVVAAGVMLAASSSANAQDAPKEPRRVRVGVGPQFVPKYPGSDEIVLRPLVALSTTRGDTPFAFSAPDQSFGPALFRSDKWQAGPAISLEGKRKRADTNGLLPARGITVEAGAYVQYNLTPSFRLRSEVRKGIGGHQGVVGSIAADYVMRDADRWLFSVGPRATFVNGRYNRAYFSIDPASAAAIGTSAYNPGGGLQSVGAATTAIYQFSPSWGVSGYAKYDRLVDDAARSPVVRVFGSRDQFAGGAALTYTFTMKR